MERSPAVAGLFYPAEPGPLGAAVDRALQAGGGGPGEPHRALVVPHAGYLYSGATAGRTYAAACVPDVVVLLGPNHTGLGRPVAVWPRGLWRTPLGPVPVDATLAARLLASHAALEPDTRAHLHEHALEVQLPFLLRRNRRVRVVPVCLADLGEEVLLELGAALARVLGGMEEAWLLVISSDMTHYASREAARARDRLAIACMERVDASGLYRTVREHRISMCGVVPAVVGLAAAAACGATAGRLVDYSCSGDVTGDDADVVAYAGLTVA